MKNSSRKRNRKFQPGAYSTPGQSKPKNLDRYGKLWNTIEFSLEGARKNAHAKNASVAVTI